MEELGAIQDSSHFWFLLHALKLPKVMFTVKNWLEGVWFIPWGSKDKICQLKRWSWGPGESRHPLLQWLWQHSLSAASRQLWSPPILGLELGRADLLPKGLALYGLIMCHGSFPTSLLPAWGYPVLGTSPTGLLYYRAVCLLTHILSSRVSLWQGPGHTQWLCYVPSQFNQTSDLPLCGAPADSVCRD